MITATWGDGAGEALRSCWAGWSSVEEVCRVGRIVAVANQKGGVAKTTSVVSLGAAFADAGLRVLLVDLDAQACLTFSLGVDPEDVELSVSDVLLERVPVADVAMRLEGGVDL